MLGRSKPEMKLFCAPIPRWSTISALVGASAVAVRAMRGRSGNMSTRRASSRYSGRKSWPHCERQWASSIATRERRADLSRAGGSRLTSVSGAMEKQVQLAPLDVAPEQVLFRTPEPGVERRRLDPGLPQRRHLVFHQRNERRDDEADARADQRRDLVAERLASTCRHQDERMMAGDH